MDMKRREFIRALGGAATVTIGRFLGFDYDN